jgi:predicted nucleic acid-binding protein
MSAERYTFDTNILFYAADNTAGHRHRRALALTQDAIAHDCILTLQSLAELANALLKRRVASVLKIEQIVGAYRSSFPVTAATEADLADAIDTHRTYNISFWDACSGPLRAAPAALFSYRRTFRTGEFWEASPSAIRSPQASK